MFFEKKKVILLCPAILRFVKCDKKGAYEMVDFTNATVTEDGSRECVNTTGIMEIYDEKPVYECIQKEEKICHYTYVTQFLPTRHKECDHHYEKTCKVSTKIPSKYLRRIA